MAHTLYNEVTAVTGIGYPTNRVLGSLDTPAISLPYSLEDIKISHNDFAVTEVYNDSIRKLYRNYLWLIANAEMVTSQYPTSAHPYYINIDNNFLPTFVSTDLNPASGNSLSSMYGHVQTHITKKLDSDEFVYFLYSKGESAVLESSTGFRTLSLSTILSGNFVEYSRDDKNAFKFKRVAGVDIVDEFLFVLDRGHKTLFKFEASGLLTNDVAVKRTTAKVSRVDEKPGRILLKTLGGTQYTQVKNRLVDPVDFSIHKEKIYILDNGARSIKIYDLNFNYIEEIKHGDLFTFPVGLLPEEPVSIVVDELSNTNTNSRGYILTNKGRIFEYDPVTRVIGDPVSIFESYLPYEIYVFPEARPASTIAQQKLYKPEGSNFKKIVNSKSSKNILYIASNRNIYKLYKTALDTPITRLDFGTGKINHPGVGPNSKWTTPINLTTDFQNTSAQTIASFDSVLHDGHDYLAITTTTLSSVVSGNQVDTYSGPPVWPASGHKTSTYLFKDKNTTTKLYNETFYTNYFTLSDIYVLPQEIVNHITFNKTTKKLIYNHYSFFENLNKKIYTHYTKANLGTSIVPAICVVNDHGFERLSTFDSNDDFWIGVNEPLLTDVVNRPIELLYKQQETLFDCIKESTLNTDPPSGVATRLPGVGDMTTNVVTLDSASLKVSSGDVVSLGISRANLVSVIDNACAVHVYTIPGDNTSTDDFDYINELTPSTVRFESGISNITIEFTTDKFFAKDAKGTVVNRDKYNEDPSAYNRSFRVIIKEIEDGNCIIDEDQINSTPECKVTIEPDFELYDITIEGAQVFTNPTGKAGDPVGYVAQVEIRRTVDDNNYSLSAACNIETNSVNWPTDMDYTPMIPGNDVYGIYSTDSETGDRDVAADFPPVAGGTNDAQVSAAQLSNTSTIFFQPGVSSVIFDLSAEYIPGFNTNFDQGAKIDVRIYRPTANAVINKADDNPDLTQGIMLSQVYKTISLYVSSISAMHRVDSHSETNQALLSCVNVWEALSASTEAINGNAFSTVSATNPISAAFIIDEPSSTTALSSLSIISTSDLLPALYFKITRKPGKDPLTFKHFNNQIDIVVKNSGNVIIGKGGKGGNGLAIEGVDRGTRFDNEDDRVNIGSWESGTLTTWTGSSGGPAISGFDDHFNKRILITNNGKVYGGAGGGGGGLPAVSSAQMPAHTSPLWYGCGGGGGGGVHALNVGAGGSCAVKNISSQPPDMDITKAFLQDGSAATPSWTGTGGAGGTWDTTGQYYPEIELQKAVPATVDGDTTAIDAISSTVTLFRAMTGNEGGGLGEPGKSDGAPASTNYYTRSSDLSLPLKDRVSDTVTHTDISYNNVLDNYKLRVGGAAGDILSTSLDAVTAGSGTFHGSGTDDRFSAA